MAMQVRTGVGKYLPSQAAPAAAAAQGAGVLSKAQKAAPVKQTMNFDSW